jgi:hypothetical protein
MQINPTELGRLVWFVFSICALMAAWQVAVVPTLQDCFRLKLFGIRRRLFLYMADGNIEANHPAYTRLRSSINASLRFTERLSFVRVVVGALMSRSEISEQNEQRKAAMSSTTPEVQNQLEKYNNELGKAISLHLLAVSPSLWLIVIGLVLTALVYVIIHRATTATSKLCTSTGSAIIELISIEDREIVLGTSIVPHRAFAGS